MRSYGITNCAPYAAAPPVGAAGDTYWNTSNSILYVSDGTKWVPIQSTGGSGPLILDSGWHYFDSFGEPALPINRYDPSGKTWPPGRFRRDAAGCVFIEAMLSGLTGTGRTILTTLPPGFRPNQTVLLACAMGVSGQGVVEVNTAGVVTLIAGSATSTWLQLASTFMADDVQTIPWVDMTPGLTSGWLPFSPSGYSYPRYFVDNVGDIHFSGQIYGGSSLAANPFYTLPSDLAPSGQLVHPTCAGPWSQNSMGPAQHARVDIQANGNMYVAGYSGSGNNGFVSLDGIVLSNPKGYWYVPALTGSWVAYGGAFCVPSFIINRNGVLALRGLMKGGVVTAPTTIVAANGLPLPPHYQQAFLADANTSAMSRIDCVVDGSMQVVGFFNGGTNGYVSWNGRYFIVADGPGVSL